MIAGYPFETGRLYKRRDQIHRPFGGQMQGGISTPSGCPALFLFTGESGERYGYKDGWSSDGVFQYVGEGQIGDMQFVRGNRAILDHVKNGKDLLLFKSEGKGQSVRFIGSFHCASWEYRKGRDRKGNNRQLIVFNLVSVNDTPGSSVDLDDAGTSEGKSIEVLRADALAAAQELSQGQKSQAKSTYYRRSTLIRRYVLARAGGKCEACNKPAPFVTGKDIPYLEPHHIRRVSDGGPDHPRWVAAVCPNCHREAHHGMGGQALNQMLKEKLWELEKG